MTCQVLTHSRISCYRDCPRKHFLRYELGLVAERDNLPRRIGSALHEAFDLVDKGRDPAVALNALESPFDQAMVTAMFVRHSQRYDNEDMEPVASELEFDLPLVNPDTGAATPVWRFRGKIDRIVKLPDGRLALMEYKSTTHDFSPGAEYWQRLHMDQQLSLYVIAARKLGYDIQTILYDVTRRPGLRPLKATPDENRKYKKDGSLYANQRDADETSDEFFQRIMADIDTKGPDHYFARIEIARLDQDLKDCQAELWQQQGAIREAQRSGRWYRNPNNCHGFFTCDYLPVCMNRDLDVVTPAGFVRNADIHPELDNAASEG